MKKILFFVFFLAATAICTSTYAAVAKKSKNSKTEQQSKKVKIVQQDTAYTYTEYCCDGTVYVTVDIWHWPDDPSQGPTIEHHTIGQPCPVCPPV